MIQQVAEKNTKQNSHFFIDLEKWVYWKYAGEAKKIFYVRFEDTFLQKSGNCRVGERKQFNLWRVTVEGLWLVFEITNFSIGDFCILAKLSYFDDVLNAFWFLGFFNFKFLKWNHFITYDLREFSEKNG